MWAKRWLGLSMYWMYIGEKNLTLVAALKIVAAHGGIAATSKRANKFRQEEQAKKAIQRNKNQGLCKQNAEILMERKDRVLNTVCVQWKGYFDLRALHEGSPYRPS
jgi:hypothetical protein